jgi:hypothetical protein
MRIRQSYLGQADKCLRSLQYELEAPPDQYRSGIIRAIGTAYHAGGLQLFAPPDGPSLSIVR